MERAREIDVIVKRFFTERHLFTSVGTLSCSWQREMQREQLIS